MDKEPQASGAVDYKTLFLGAAVLVSLLGGGLWNVWNSYHIGNEDEQRKTNDLQWERLRELATSAADNKTTIERLRYDAADHEDRIRAIEHRLSDNAYREAGKERRR
jgi:hypothetical protein